MKLSLSHLGERAGWYDEALIEEFRGIAAEVGSEEDVVSLILVDDPYIRKLNRDFRNVDRETDVISFSFLEEEYPVDDDLTGEVYISRDTLEKEAKSRGVDVRKLFLRTALHGLLHVYGYDHESQDEAGTMEGEERRLLQNVLSRGDIEALFA